MQGWVRSFHGTGVGTSTNDGFWIPGPPPEKEPSPEPLPPPPPKEKKAPRRAGQKTKANPPALDGGSKGTRSGSAKASTAVGDGKEEEELKPRPGPLRRSKPARKDEEEDGPPKVKML